MSVFELSIIGFLVTVVLAWLGSDERRYRNVGLVIVIFGLVLGGWFYFKAPVNNADFPSKYVRVTSVSKTESGSESLVIRTTDNEYILPKADVSYESYDGLLRTHWDESAAKIWTESLDSPIVTGFEAGNLKVDPAKVALVRTEQNRKIFHFGIIVVFIGILIVVLSSGRRH